METNVLIIIMLILLYLLLLNNMLNMLYLKPFYTIYIGIILLDLQCHLYKMDDEKQSMDTCTSKCLMYCTANGQLECLKKFIENKFTIKMISSFASTFKLFILKKRQIWESGFQKDWPKYETLHLFLSD